MTLSSSLEYEALCEAVRSGLGFRDAAETERVARWALAEIDHLRGQHERDLIHVREAHESRRLADAEVDRLRKQVLRRDALIARLRQRCCCGSGEAEDDRSAVLRCPVHGALDRGPIDA